MFIHGQIKSAFNCIQVCAFSSANNVNQNTEGKLTKEKVRTKIKQADLVVCQLLKAVKMFQTKQMMKNLERRCFQASTTKKKQNKQKIS